MSEKKQITVCICYDGDEKKLNKTMVSFGDSYAERVKTVVLERRGQEGSCGESVSADRGAAENSSYGMAGKGPEDTSEAAAKEKAGKWDCGIVWCCDAAMAAAQVTTEFVTVISAGETWHGNALEQAVQYLSSVQDAADAVLCEHVTRKTPAKDGASAGGKVVSLTKAKEILRLPGSLHGILFCTDAIREELPELIGEDGWDEVLAVSGTWAKADGCICKKSLLLCRIYLSASRRISSGMAGRRLVHAQATADRIASGGGCFSFFAGTGAFGDRNFFQRKRRKAE